MNLNTYAMAFKHEVCRGRRGSGRSGKSGSGHAYVLALARLASACTPRNGTRIVGLNKSGCGCPPPAFAKASAGKPASGRRLPLEAPPCRCARGTSFMKYDYLLQSLAVPGQRYIGIAANLDIRLRAYTAGGSPPHVQVSPLEVSAASLRPTRSSNLRDHVVDGSFLDGHSFAFGVFVAHLRFWLPLSRQLFRLSDLVRCHLFVERITRHRRSLFPICDREAVPHVGLDKIPGYSSSLFIHDAPAPTTWAYFSRCRLHSCSVCGHYSRG